MITLVRNQIEKTPERRKAVRTVESSSLQKFKKAKCASPQKSSVVFELRNSSETQTSLQEKQGCWVLLDEDQCNASLVIRGALFSYPEGMWQFRL